jgi:UDP-glucose 4-epimerase
MDCDMRERPTALVLGGGGFLGTNLCRALLAAGHSVGAFGRRPQFPAEVAGVEWIEGEFADRDAVARALEGREVVFHLIHGNAPQGAELDPIGDLENNVAPTIAMLQACLAAGVRRVVFVSSGGTVYGRAAILPTPETAPTEPISVYGVAKLAIEKYLGLFEHRYRLEYRALRVANPFGPYQTARKAQGVIAALALKALRGEPIEIWGDGSVVRDFVYVDDVSEALRLAASDGGAHRVYNIGSGVGRSLREVIAAIEAILGRPLDLAFRPGRALDVPVSIVDVSRAREGLGWAPRTSFDEGLRRTIAWAKTRV